GNGPTNGRPPTREAPGEGRGLLFDCTAPARSLEVPVMLNVGLVGFGFAGKVFHAPVIRAVEGLVLAAIVRRRGGRDVLHSVDELLARAIDLVVIATPNTSHYAIAKQCLLAGRHVVIDKPFAPTLREAQDLAELAKQQRRVLSVYHNRRYVGDFVTLQRLVSGGTLGRIVAYESHFDRFRPELKPGAWRERAEPGAGGWFDIGPHLLDQAFVLFGTPRAVAADIRLGAAGRPGATGLPVRCTTAPSRGERWRRVLR